VSNLLEEIQPYSFFRYHFEAIKGRFLPTLTFSGGRVDVSVIWPEAVEQLPAITDVYNLFLSLKRKFLFVIDSNLSMDSSPNGYI
jgi:hypothetical protein